MLNADALDVLELAPLWRRRRSGEASVAQWSVIVVTDANDRHGWIVFAPAPEGEALRLFEYMLAALKLTRREDFALASASLMNAVRERAPNWLWLTERSMRAEGNELPLFTSPSPVALLADGRLKAQLWADWCGWQTGMN